jgi:N,N'-diacetyllegionaminate synthase
MKIADRVGPDRPCLVIAEAGVNHNGDMALAHKLIDAARATGADAVKFQAFVTEELVTMHAEKAGYQHVTTGGGSQFAMLKALELDGAQHAALKAHCDAANIGYLCTPYDDPSIEMLDRLGVDAFKVASTDTDNVPFLRNLAAKGRPVLLSTGMADVAELEASVRALRDAPARPWIALLQCTSEYPAPIGDCNLRAMETMRRAFGCPVGFSDHTEGTGAAPLAVALGACIVEKHFTLDRAMKGPDHRASLDPAGFAALVTAVREAEAALGDGIKRPAASEVANKAHMRKSLVARRAIAAGHMIVTDDLACKRPGTGLPPQWFDRMIGRRAARDIAADEQIELGSVAW